MAVTLQPGAAAHAQLRIVQAGDFDTSTCRPTPADTLIVYPPDQERSLRVATRNYIGCANGNTPILTVRALEAGTGR